MLTVRNFKDVTFPEYLINLSDIKQISMYL